MVFNYFQFFFALSFEQICDRKPCFSSGAKNVDNCCFLRQKIFPCRGIPKESIVNWGKKHLCERGKFEGHNSIGDEGRERIRRREKEKEAFAIGGKEERKERE